MIVLAFDCASSQCAATLLLGEDTILSKVEARDRGQAERLVPMLMELLAEAQMDFGNIDRVAVTTGPGSFTGVRVGLSAAMGLSLARDIPVIGIDSFTAFAASLPQTKNLAIVIESKRRELYWQIMDGSSMPRCDVVEDIVQALPHSVEIIGGDAAAKLENLLDKPVAMSQLPGPDMAVVAQLARTMPTPENFPGPFYVRPPDAKLPSSFRP
jgi:tRNA threonylcarbamoyl adenosine modification protein YeaZ